MFVDAVPVDNSKTGMLKVKHAVDNGQLLV